MVFKNLCIDLCPLDEIASALEGLKQTDLEMLQSLY